MIRKNPILLLLITCGLFLSGTDRAAESGAPPRLTDLGWLAGTWSAESNGLLMEEHWMPPRGGILLGLHRDSRPDKPAFFEFLRIEEGEDGIVYLASPRGRPATPFKMIEMMGTRVVFENTSHDFPQRIIYERKGDQLTARVEGEVDGEARHSQWVWSLQNR